MPDRRILIVCGAIAALLVPSRGLAAVPQGVAAEQAEDWLAHLVPLPKTIQISGRVVTAPDKVRVEAADAAEPLVGQAVAELRECLGAPQTEGETAFTIRITFGGPAANELAKLPNADQAYLIRPAEDGAGLLLIGGGPRGAYYAGKTLQQLVRARRKAEKVELPLLRVTDWPDLEDRGLWGGDSYHQLRWMSDRKLNIDEQIASNRVDTRGQTEVGLRGDKQKMIDEGPALGVRPVPVVLHLEQISASGLFQAYPQLRGKGPADRLHPGAICYSRPEFPDVLAEWLLLWSSKPGVTEVDVWMAENMGGKTGCRCEHCANEDRSVLEARAIAAGWKKARQTRPDLGLRVLTSEATEDSNPQVFAQLPPDVKIWYYHSLATYNASESPMVPPYLAETARQRWVGVCCNFCAVVQFWQPFTGPQFIRARMNEFVDKKIGGVIGYAVPRLALTRFNTEAAAEWSWNAKGRSTRAFALSWAIREGYADPKLFADWTEVHGPVAWDMYGSDFPSGEKRRQPGPTVDLLRKGKLPELGVPSASVTAKPWGDIKSVEQLERDVRDAARSVELARQLGMPEFLQESLVIDGYVKAVKALWELRGLVRSGRVAEADRPAARDGFRTYAAGLAQARDGLRAWDRVMAGQTGGRGGVVARPVEIVGAMIADMQAFAREVGCE